MEGGVQSKGGYWVSNLDIYISITGCCRADQARAPQTEEYLLTGWLTLRDVIPVVLLFRGLSRLRARKQHTELLHR